MEVKYDAIKGKTVKEAIEIIKDNLSSKPMGDLTVRELHDEWGGWKCGVYVFFHKRDAECFYIGKAASWNLINRGVAQHLTELHYGKHIPPEDRREFLDAHVAFITMEGCCYAANSLEKILVRALQPLKNKSYKGKVEYDRYIESGTVGDIPNPV